MPSGFFILLRHFLRVDNVLLKIHDTRFHYEVGNDYIFKEYTKRAATYEELKKVSVLYVFVIHNQWYLEFLLKYAQLTKLYCYKESG